LSFSATARSTASERASSSARPAANSTFALISMLTPRRLCVTRTLPSFTSGAITSIRLLATSVMCVRSSIACCCLRVRRLTSGGSATVGRCGTGTSVSGLPNALPSAPASTRYLFSLTAEMAYMTTKKANRSVMKSAYEISQRSWLS